MVMRNVTTEQREKTIKLLFEDLPTYRRRDRKFYEASSMQSSVYYVLGSPPYKKRKDLVACGWHPRLTSRLILLPKYLVYLTEWTPEKAENTKKITLGSFVKEVTVGTITEMAADFTWGATELLGMIGSAVIPKKALALLGKKPEEMLVNPWSLIIPLADIRQYEIAKAGFFVHYLYLKIEHRFEGPLNVGITYHSGGAHTRAEGLYRKLKKILPV